MRLQWSIIRVQDRALNRAASTLAAIGFHVGFENDWSFWKKWAEWNPVIFLFMRHTRLGWTVFPFDDQGLTSMATGSAVCAH